MKRNAAGRQGARDRRRAAFTLIEMVISSALMALILTGSYLCLNAGIAAQRLIDPRVEAVQSARVVLALMTADLRCACPLTKEAEFVGMNRELGDVEADNVDFATHHYTPGHAGEGDYCQISYFLEQDRESRRYSLWRRRNPRIGPDPFSGGRREELAQGLRKLKFEYYDGFEWYDTWGDPDGRAAGQGSALTAFNLSGMPEAVRITIWMDSERRPDGATPSVASTNAPPLMFQTVARLNVRGATGNSGSGSGSTGAGGSGARGGGN